MSYPRIADTGTISNGSHCFSVCVVLVQYQFTEGFRLLPVSICFQHFALLREIIWSSHCLLQRTSDLSFVTPGDQKLLFVNFAQLLHERSTSDLSDGWTHVLVQHSAIMLKKIIKQLLLVFGWETTISSLLTVAPGCGLSWWQLFSSCSFSGCLFHGCFLHKTNWGMLCGPWPFPRPHSKSCFWKATLGQWQ